MEAARTELTFGFSERSRVSSYRQVISAAALGYESSKASGKTGLEVREVGKWLRSSPRLVQLGTMAFSS